MPRSRCRLSPPRKRGSTSSLRGHLSGSRIRPSTSLRTLSLSKGGNDAEGALAKPYFSLQSRSANLEAVKMRGATRQLMKQFESVFGESQSLSRVADPVLEMDGQLFVSMNGQGRSEEPHV